jgi:hypothetical protein
MNIEIDAMKYYMAAEKVSNLIYSIEITLEFLEEFKIEADENVKGALGPCVDKLKEWLK